MTTAALGTVEWVVFGRLQQFSPEQIVAQLTLTQRRFLDLALTVAASHAICHEIEPRHSGAERVLLGLEGVRGGRIRRRIHDLRADVRPLSVAEQRSHIAVFQRAGVLKQGWARRSHPSPFGPAAPPKSLFSTMWDINTTSHDRLTDIMDEAPREIAALSGLPWNVAAGVHAHAAVVNVYGSGRMPMPLVSDAIKEYAAASVDYLAGLRLMGLVTPHLGGPKSVASERSIGEDPDARRDWRKHRGMPNRSQRRKVTRQTDDRIAGFLMICGMSANTLEMMSTLDPSALRAVATIAQRLITQGHLDMRHLEFAHGDELTAAVGDPRTSPVAKAWKAIAVSADAHDGLVRDYSGARVAEVIL